MKELKYNYYIDGNRVICTTKLGDKKFRGVAVCSTDDSFNEETGKKIAKARVDIRVASYKEKQAFGNYMRVLNAAEYFENLSSEKFSKWNKVREEESIAKARLGQILADTEASIRI